MFRNIDNSNKKFLIIIIIEIFDKSLKNQSNIQN